MTIDIHFVYIVSGGVDGSLRVSDPEGKRELEKFPKGHKSNLEALF